MPFTLIKGKFRPAAGVPDGDSVRFEPDDRDLMRSVPGVRMLPNAATVTLRYEGIDALEKHAIQPHAQDARDANLQLLQTRGPEDTVGSRGFILTRAGDKKSGRPVCFVFVGETAEVDGTSVFLDSERLRKSVNYLLISAGMVYPLFYETLFMELRTELVSGLTIARNENRGHINLDQSGTGVHYTGPSNLDAIPPVFPKLFRRLDDWNGSTLGGFFSWLERNDNERVHTLSDGKFIGFQDVLELSDDKVRMLYNPEDMVFRPKGPGPQPD